MTKVVSIFLLALLSAASSWAEIKTQVVQYTHDGQALEGWVAYDDAKTGKRPAVLIAHQWKGLGDYEKKRAEMLAKLGYVAFAADIYGKGVRPSERGAAAAEAGKYKNNRALLRGRVNAALTQLRKHDLVDGSKIAAIGYCFGGTTVLELARSGAEVDGVVSFHGGLGSPTPEDAEKIKGKVLVLHGAVDPFVPTDEVLAFGEEMSNANVDWQLVAYGGAVHSFTDRNAGNDPSTGSAYDEKADKRSWEDMRQFFREIFGESEK